MEKKERLFSLKEKSHELAELETNYRKSNFIIAMKYKSSLLENKVVHVSLSKFANGEYEERPDGTLIVKLKAAELRRLTNSKGGSFYSRLDPVARSLNSHYAGWTNPETRQFDYISIVTRARYADGIFTIYYNPDLRGYIKDLKQNYTILNLGTVLSFKTNYALRLYEVLRCQAYPKKGQPAGDGYHISYPLNELKLDLGVVNAESQKVQSVLANQAAPDYEKAVEVAPEKSYDDWRDFKKWVLEPAVAEINDLSDIQVTYDSNGYGRGGKVYKLDFFVSYKKRDHKIDPEAMEDLIDEIADLIPCRLKIREYRTIGEAAGFDMKKVEKAVEVLNAYDEEVENVCGFLVEAIQKDWSVIRPETKRKKEGEIRLQVVSDWEE